jgi:hypothetical protein
VLRVRACADENEAQAMDTAFLSVGFSLDAKPPVKGGGNDGKPRNRASATFHSGLIPRSKRLMILAAVRYASRTAKVATCLARLGQAPPGVLAKEVRVWREPLWELEAGPLKAKQPSQAGFHALSRLAKAGSKADREVRIDPHEMAVESAIVKCIQAQAILGI